MSYIVILMSFQTIYSINYGTSKKTELKNKLRALNLHDFSVYLNVYMHVAEFLCKTNHMYVFGCVIVHCFYFTNEFRICNNSSANSMIDEEYIYLHNIILCG